MREEEAWQEWGAKRTLTVDQSGTPGGYILYTHRAGAPTATIDAADKADQCVEVRASHVILRGLTLRGPRIHGIVLGPGAHDVVIERCDISMHPYGLAHGPQPGMTEASIGKKETKELAVMVDTFYPLNLTSQALEYEKPEYMSSWLEGSGE